MQGSMAFNLKYSFILNICGHGHGDTTGVTVKRMTKSCEICFDDMYIETSNGYKKWRYVIGVWVMLIVLFFQHNKCKRSYRIINPIKQKLSLLFILFHSR